MYYIQLLHQLLLATMDNFNWQIQLTPTSMEAISMEAGLKCVIMAPTAQFVMMGGLMRMLQLSAIM